jgi:5-methylcytosine-specific restriction endonuclease McrA
MIAAAKKWVGNNPERAREIWHKHHQKQNTGRPPGTPRYEGPCITCGSLEPRGKYFVNKVCRPCYKKAEWAKNHPKSIRTIKCVDCGIEWQIQKGKGTERCRNCHAKWQWVNDTAFRERHKKQRKQSAQTKNGIETNRRHLRKRRAVLAGAIFTLTREEWESILLQHGHSCAYCGSKERIELDHVIPISKGGTHTKDNVVPACRTCNATKCDKPLEQFMTKLK